MKVALFLASKSDEAHAQKILDLLKEFGVPVETTVASAHKVPEKVFEKVEELNGSMEPTVIITCVGLSNGLSGVVAGSSRHPVIACPVFKDNEDYLVNIHSTLQMPSEVPVMTVLHPKNAALAAIRILAESDEALQKKVATRIAEVKSKY
jgi:phosphoribosylaminoimidazole carboxylase PurE protein